MTLLLTCFQARPFCSVVLSKFMSCKHTPDAGIAFGDESQVREGEATYGSDWNGESLVGVKALLSTFPRVHFRFLSQIRVRRNVTASPPVTGTFDVSFAGGAHDNLQNINADVTEEDLATQLKSLGGINDLSVTRGGTCYG